jgi:hypothetical protein
VTPAQKQWTKILHTAKRECGLDDEAYRALLWGAAGITSASEITAWAQYKAVLTAFGKLGFRVKHTGKTALKQPNRDYTERNPDWITERQEYYIRGLWDLASRKKDDASLRAIIRRISGGDDIRFLQKRHATAVILALRDIAGKAGYSPDGPTGKAV